MTTHPPLTDTEKYLLAALAVRTVAAQSGASEQTCADALDEIAGNGHAVIRWDDQDAYLLCCGHVIVHAARDWLRYHAHAQLN